MTTLSPDAIVLVSLKSTKEGGRAAPLPGPLFKCPVFFGDEREQGYECAFLIPEADGELEPGGTSRVIPIKFLALDLVMDKLHPGSTFTLWEGRDVGYAEVLEVLARDDGRRSLGGGNRRR